MAGFENDVLVAKNLNFDDAASPPHAGIIDAAGKLPIGTGNTSPTPEILGGSLTSPDNSITFGYSSPNITAVVNSAVIQDLHTARYIVSAGGLADGANYTTIQSAINDAQGAGGNQTIFIQPGTYTENFTLPVGVNLAAYDCDAFSPNVIISGTVTINTAGSFSISGIRLQTNSAFALVISGTAASVVTLTQCFINCTNNTGISFTSSSASASVRLFTCGGNVGTTGITFFQHTSPGQLNLNSCSTITNTGGSSTASTISGGGVFNLVRTDFLVPISASSNSACVAAWCSINTSAVNTACITLTDTATASLFWVSLSSGTASSVTVTANAILNSRGHLTVESSNINALNGLGTVRYSLITYVGASSTNGIATQVVFPSQPAPGWQLLETQTASASATLDFTNIGLYNNYAFVISNLVPSVNGVQLNLLYSDDGGATYETTGYVCAVDPNRVGVAFHAELTTSTAAAPLCQASSYGTASKAGGVVYLNGTRFLSSTSATISGTLTTNGNGGGACSYLSMGDLGNAADIDAIRIAPASGNLTSGTISLYGIGN